jgi:undecaprenyl phosphate-alpha-L-ara4N flippase subunit ArnE
MFRVILLTILQCFLLACGQVCFKLAVEKIEKFQWIGSFFSKLLTNWWLLASGICLVSATVLWGYILKHFEFSIAYPITAFAYVFGMLAAMFIFHETIPLTRWLGVGFIIIGVVLLVQK